MMVIMMTVMMIMVTVMTSVLMMMDDELDVASVVMVALWLTSCC